MVSVIFPAAGEGRRMNAGKNKVFVELLGKPILVRTLLRFSECAAVDDFVQDAEQFDDMTMLCLEYRGPQAAEKED